MKGAGSAQDGPEDDDASEPGRRRRFLWFALAVLIIATVLAYTVNFRATGAVLAALLVVLAVLRALGRLEAEMFAARSRALDVVMLLGVATGMVLFSVIAPA